MTYRREEARSSVVARSRSWTKKSGGALTGETSIRHAGWKVAL
ncbi:hypothetical protein ACTHO5_07350 [Cytobacillus praedii]